jgi:hypothetical protein
MPFKKWTCKTVTSYGAEAWKCQEITRKYWRSVLMSVIEVNTQKERWKIKGKVSKIINTAQTLKNTEKGDERMGANNIRKTELNFDSMRKRNTGGS